MRREGTHLTYCLNIHPGETWEENLAAIRMYATEVKQRISPDKPFGLGLRLSARAASELRPQVPAFRDYLADAGMYVFTINGFPYGQFHGARVKEKVYLPDWSTPERLAYTETLAAILADLLPEGVRGSISTVPVAYGKTLPERSVENLLAAARTLARLESKTGRTVTLALEPEPDCFLETCDEVLSFWDELRSRAGEELAFLGVCVDTCHAAVNFERPADTLRRLREAGVPVPKVQLSAALSVEAGRDARALLKAFVEETYLHQTRVRAGGEVLRFADLPEALAAGPTGEWRVHFHVPLHFEGARGLTGTSDLLDDELFREALASRAHLEAETYTFDVMPATTERAGLPDVVDSVTAELEWVLARLS